LGALYPYKRQTHRKFFKNEDRFVIIILWMIYTIKYSIVILLSDYATTLRPRLEGGPLKGAYDFSSIEFRWGPADDEGSEHSIDYVRYPMELQVVHTKRQNCMLPDITSNDRDRLAILTYFFEVRISILLILSMIVNGLLVDLINTSSLSNLPLERKAS
jgi:hypothetical protein